MRSNARTRTGKGLILLGFGGGPFRARTGDPLIKSSPKQVSQVNSNQKFPMFLRYLRSLLWVNLVSSATSSRTIHGQIPNSGLALRPRFTGERLYGRKSLRRGTSRMG